MTLTTRDRAVVDRLGAAGLKYPRTTVEEARNVGIPLSYALAFLEKATPGADADGAMRFGLNVFGDDPQSGNPVRGGAVTRSRYLEYVEHRRRGRGMQGVGPMQLRWYALQDLADRLGGCWQPRYSMRVGFAQAKALVRRDGRAAGAARYDGGASADTWARDWLAKQNKWQRWLTRNL